MLFDSTEELVLDAGIVAVGRLTDTSVSPGRDVYTNSSDGELLYSTVFIRLDVETVIKFDAEYPIGSEVILERLLPAHVTVEDFGAAAPVGDRVLFAARDVTDLGSFHASENELIGAGERAYSPYLQAVVVENPGREPQTIQPSQLGVFADRAEGNQGRSFSELVEMVTDATN